MKFKIEKSKPLSAMTDEEVESEIKERHRSGKLMFLFLFLLSVISLVRNIIWKPNEIPFMALFLLAIMPGVVALQTQLEVIARTEKRLRVLMGKWTLTE